MDLARPFCPRRGQCPPFEEFDVDGSSSEDENRLIDSAGCSPGSPTLSEHIAQISVEILPPYPGINLQGSIRPFFYSESRPDIIVGLPEASKDTSLQGATLGEFPVDQKQVKETTLSPPDGGVRAWISILACCGLLILSSGMGKAFGDVKQAITAELDCSHAVLAMIPGIFSAGTLFWAPVTSALIRNYGCRLMLAVGGGLCLLGFIVSGSADSGEYLVVSLGLLVGTGFSIVANYTVFVIGKLFKGRKAWALAVTLSGGCIGHMLLPRIFALALPAFGPRGIFGFLAVGSALWIAICLYIVGDPESQMVRQVTMVAAPAVVQVPEPKAEGSSAMRRFNRLSDELGLPLMTDRRFWLVSVSAVFFGLGSPTMGSAISTHGGFTDFDYGELFCFVSSVVMRLSYGVYSPHSRFDRTAEYAVAVFGATVAFGILTGAPSAGWVPYAAGALFSGAWAVLIPATLGQLLGAANIGKSFALVKLCRGFISACWLVPKSELKGLLGPTGSLWLDFAFCVVGALTAILLYILEKKKPAPKSPEPEDNSEDLLIGVFFLYSL